MEQVNKPEKKDDNVDRTWRSAWPDANKNTDLYKFIYTRQQFGSCHKTRVNPAWRSYA